MRLARFPRSYEINGTVDIYMSITKTYETKRLFARPLLLEKLMMAQLVKQVPRFIESVIFVIVTAFLGCDAV
jgi:hypothetical protein